MSSRTPFPALLRGALWGSVAAFVLAFLVPLALGNGGAGDFAKGAFVFLVAISALLALVAVPAAVWLLVRGGPYVAPGNIALTVIALLPLALVAAVAFTLKYGHFHI